MVQDFKSMLAMNESEGRKWTKPVMEKKRRERINKSLEELKLLVLEAQHRDSSRYTRLEKADILEMTVKHLRAIRNKRNSVFNQIPSQPFLSEMHFGCCHCLPNSKTPPNLITIETVSRHQRIAPNPNQYVTPVKYDSNASGTHSVPLGLSSPTAGNLAYRKTAVQYIPLQQDEMKNGHLSCSESSGRFWRPF